MKKLIRDGKVAVLYSPGFGAGWSTWNISLPEMIFSPILVEAVEQGRQGDIDEDFVRAALDLPKDEHVCVLGANGLKIEWLPEGTRFFIDEYDGSESIRTESDFNIA